MKKNFSFHPASASSLFDLHVSVSVMLLTVIAVCAVGIRAQSNTFFQTPAALSPASSPNGNELTNYESVNLYNGGLKFSIPLLQVGGRGEAGYTMTLPIQHKWQTVRDDAIPTDPFFYPQYSWWNTVSPGYGPGVVLGRQTASECQSFGEATVTTTQLTFIAPDGNEIELIDTLTHGQPLTSHCPVNYPGVGASRGNVFVSRDGSGVTFVSTTTIYDYVGSNTTHPHIVHPSGVLRFGNGNRYIIENGLVLKIIDRNGNKVTFTYNAGRVTGIVDSLGRAISIEYNIDEGEQYGICDKINFSGFGGASRAIRISKGRLNAALADGESIKTFAQLFPLMSTSTHEVDPDNIVSSVWLPDGKRFAFSYNAYVDLADVVFPNGITVSYVWWGSHGAASIYRRLNERRIYTHEGVLSGKTIYDVPEYSTPSPIVVRQKSPDDQLISLRRHYFHGNAWVESTPRAPNQPPFAWDAGMQYSVELFAGDGVTPLSRSITKWQNRPTPPWTEIVPWSPPNDPRPVSSITIAFEGESALVTYKTSEYDDSGSAEPTNFSHLNLKRVRTYGLKPVGTQAGLNSNLDTLSTLFTETDIVSIWENDYTYNSPYNSRGILGLVAETRLLNPANLNEVIARNQFIYDEAAFFDNSYTTTGWEDPQSNLRGNVTTTRTWHAEASSWIQTHTMFDNFGNVRKVWDTSGDATRFVETEYDPLYKYAYPTKTKAPAPDPTGVNGTTEGSEITRTYDFNTGLLLSVTDARDQTAYNEYNDPYNRLTKTIPPAGGSISEIIYNDTPGNVWVKSRQQIDENNWAESTVFYDNLGRAVKGRTKDLQGDIVSEVRFDSFGRVEKTSSPYRVDAQGNPTETVYWSKVRYDHANRVVETYAPAPDGQTGISLGTVEFGISDLPGLIGTYTVAIDASGRKSRAVSGIYGLMRIDEAVSKGGTIDQDLGTLASPAQPTHYSYNSKGELVKVTQGQQHRYFMYDSLGRLIRVRQPEQIPNANLATTGNPENNQWTSAYSYDVFGNVISMTDAKDTTITNHYDKAGRTTKRTYTDGTPEVEFFYDGKGLQSIPQFAKGALTKVTSLVSEDRFTSFDNHGRLLASEQRTDGTTYAFSYKYNLSGGLIEQTYPSGRVVRNFLDSDGGLNSVMTKPNGGWNTRVISDFDYSASGSIRKVKLGNGLWETADIDHLGQLRQVGLGTGQANNDIFKIDYEYGELQTNGTVDAAKNTGNIAKATTTIPTASFVQTFKYDAINRLTEAKETSGEATNWLQTFGYDRYGNRTSFSETIGGIVTQNSNINHPTIDPATNRFTTGQGYVYDLNGNIVQDAAGRSFTFNGDDKQTLVRDTATNAIIGEYSYDPSGARVKKHVPATGETTVFVYDAGGALAAEYSTVVETASPTTSYLTTDHLGSPRVVTDADGAVIARRDFMPFGEELGVGIGPRTENLKYSTFGSDRVRQRFTGYERDDETQLDFAEARMYQNKHGRFTAPDPLLASASAANPQTFNRYIYTGNNPANITDPSGLNWCRDSNGIKFTGERTACAKGEEDLTGQTVTIGRSGTTNNGIYMQAGWVVTFGESGTPEIQRNPEPARHAEAQGENVRQGEANVSGTPASDAAVSGSGSQGVSGTGLLSLCPTGEICPLPMKSGSPIIIKLETGASFDEVANFAQYTLEAFGMVPGLEIADAISGLISLARGDRTGALLSAGAMIPLGGQVFTAAKWANRAANAADTTADAARVVNGNSKLSEKAQHGYVIYDTLKNEVVKVGVSGGAITKSGKSYRANRQIAILNKSKAGRYESRIVKTIPSGPGARQSILDWERDASRSLRPWLDPNIHRRP